MNYKLYINTTALRPDFRLVCHWVSKDIHNLDTDGDSLNPASREWTFLYLANRENKNEYATISQDEEKVDVYLIESSTEEFGYLLTYFLAEEMNAIVSLNDDFANLIEQKDLKAKLSKYNLEEALNRTNNSIWRQSTLENPYPNL